MKDLLELKTISDITKKTNKQFEFIVKDTINKRYQMAIIRSMSID